MYKQLGRNVSRTSLAHINARCLEFANTHRSFIALPLATDVDLFVPIMDRDSNSALLRRAKDEDTSVKGVIDALKSASAGPLSLRADGIQFKTIERGKPNMPATQAAEEFAASYPEFDARRLRRVILEARGDQESLVPQELYDAATSANLHTLHPNRPLSLEIGLCSVLSSKRGEMGGQITKKIVNPLPPIIVSQLVFA